MILEGKSVLLRPLERRDEENLLRIAREPAIAKYMPDWSEGKERPEDYDALLAAEDDEGAARIFAVTLPGKDELIGMVRVGENPDLNEAELTYFMSEAYKGCGYTKEAVSLLSDWCLRRPDLPYLILLADESNASACRLAEKCGFALYEKRVTVGHRLPGMLGDVYYYYRKY
jgi:ribosomal-protein-alanine N-acetyltransferase